MRLILLIFLAVFVIVHSHTETNQANNRAWVYAVCQAAHNQVNGTSEDACGIAQDKTNTEFLCTTNTVGSGYCWVEVK